MYTTISIYSQHPFLILLNVSLLSELINSSLVDPVANVERPAALLGQSRTLWSQVNVIPETIPSFGILLPFQISPPNWTAIHSPKIPSVSFPRSYQLTVSAGDTHASLPRTGWTTGVVRSVGGTVSCVLPWNHQIFMKCVDIICIICIYLFVSIFI